MPSAVALFVVTCAQLARVLRRIERGAGAVSPCCITVLLVLAALAVCSISAVLVLVLFTLKGVLP